MLNSTILRFVEILRCPVTGEQLTILETADLEKANQQIRNGERRHGDGTPVHLPLTDAVGTRSRANIYRVADDVLWLLPDAALVAPSQASQRALSAEKNVVQSFYDEFGWVKNAGGQFNDTSKFNVARDIARDYRLTCNRRISGQLKGGTSLLDVASGAIPHPEYLDFSREYQVRICVDFSIRALHEAREKLGERGLYILGDITRLPLAAGAVDAVISLHTIYHVPKTEQSRAIDELMRVCKPGGRVVVVYTWANSAAMTTAFRIRGFLGSLKRLGRRNTSARANPGGSGNPDVPPLYFHPQDHDWFEREIASRYEVRLAVWSAISQMFQVRFLSDDKLGRAILRIVVTLENAFPRLAGRLGQYPMFIFKKAAP
jgi:SAM-dependent methyltransferase/uncharacterized protein YbaR (Trm112 family)